MNRVISFLRRLFVFAFPLSGWKDRVQRFQAGNTAWPIEGRPDLPPSCPWPIEWTPVIWTDPTENDPRGWEFVSVTCSDSGLLAEAGTPYPVNCARCGVPLHMKHANMKHDLDVPACSWCVGAVRRTR